MTAVGKTSIVKRTTKRTFKSGKSVMIQKKIKISVIMPAYNRAHCIVDSIGSVLTQDPAGFDVELIVSDDASTDNTAALFAARKGILADPRIKYIRAAKNGGVNVARNLAIAKATGDYVLFLDSDDFLVSDGLRTLAQYLPRAEKIILFATREVKTKKLMTHVDHEGKYTYENWLAGKEIGGEFLSIVARPVFTKDRFDEERFCFESFFWNRIIRKHGAFASPIVLREYSFESGNRVSDKLSDPAYADRRARDYIHYLDVFENDYVMFGLRAQLSGLHLRTGVFCALSGQMDTARQYLRQAVSYSSGLQWLLCVLILALSYLGVVAFRAFFRAARFLIR